VTVNGANSPIFIDPAENVGDRAANSVEEIGAGGKPTILNGAIGQVYAGTVNGTVVATVIAPQTYQNQPYKPVQSHQSRTGRVIAASASASASAA